MQSAKTGRPTVVSILPPIAPHLRESAVLRMLQEEEPESIRVAPQWPPPGHTISRPQGFMGKICTGKGPGGRPVEWPPRPEHGESQDQPDQINNAPNLTTTYPSGFKYREKAPLDNVPAKVVMSQPAFKISQPIRRRGDDKWPPKTGIEPVQNEVREFIKPKKMAKNYGEFFAQNALPHNYAGYRPPPGTQHRGVEDNDQDEEDEEEEETAGGVSNM